MAEVQESATIEMEEGRSHAESVYDSTMTTEKFVYDCAFVLRVPDKDEEKCAFTGPQYISALQKAGLQVKVYQSGGEDEVYCLVGATEKRLEKEADRIDLDLKFDAQKTIDIAYEKGLRLAKAMKEGSEQGKLISEECWENIYGPFDSELEKKAFFATYPSPNGVSHFRSVDRINLIVSIIEAAPKLGGAGLALSKHYLLKNTHLLAFFPLHEPKERQDLVDKWQSISGLIQSPLDDIRNYFGEKVALYFGFLQFYTYGLLIPSILGLVWFFIQIANESVSDAPGIVFFAFYVVLWATLMLENWKRLEAHYRMKWGTSNFEEKEQTRPEFNGEWIHSPVDGKLEHYFPFWRKVLRAVFSQTVVVSLITLVIASVAGVFFLRIVLEEVSPGYGSIIGGIINSIQITIFNVIYAKVSFRLNDYENHRTDTEYEDALISKSFMFKFVNSYNSLFYLAFLRRYIDPDGCDDGENCLALVRTQLATIFISQIVINNTIEMLIPFIMTKINARKESKGVDEVVPKSFPEEQYEMVTYESTFDDFDELAIQFGFVTLFIVAFPLTPLLAFVNNLIEVYVDSSKLLYVTRRPEPRQTGDIGTWQKVFATIATISVITNILLVVFLTKQFREWTEYDTAIDSLQARAIAAAAAEHVILLIKFGVEAFVDDVPFPVVQHMARQQFLVDVLIRNAEEELDDELDDTGVKGKDLGEYFVLHDVPRTLQKDEHCTW